MPLGHFSAVGQMAAATVHTLRKAASGLKSGDPTRGVLGRGKKRAFNKGYSKLTGTRKQRRKQLSQVRSARGGGAGKRARAILRKGSPEAKRHMAKLRRMRKKR